MKRSLFFIAIFTLLLSAIGCGKKKEEKKPQPKKAVTQVVKDTVPSLKENLEKLTATIKADSAECPINMGIFGDLIDVKFDERERLVSIYFSLNGDIFSLDRFRESKEKAYGLARILLGQDKTDQLTLQMIDVGASLIITFRNSINSDSFKMKVTHQKLMELEAYSLSEEDINKFILENFIALEDADCPHLIKEGIEMVSATDEEKNVVYLYHVDDSKFDMNSLKETADDMKKETEVMLSDPASRKMLEILKALDKGIIYRYLAINSGQSVDITFTPAEIGDMLSRLQQSD